MRAGGTSFDSLYVNVNGESGYFERSLNVYGREGEPCPRCGRPIKRQQWMNRSSYFCPNCQRPPRPGRRPMTEPDEGPVRLTAWVHGQVQGVGFRWWTRSRALELGLTGQATNLSDGRVEVIAEGSRSACERLLAALQSGRTPGSVEHVASRWSEARGGYQRFSER